MKKKALIMSALGEKTFTEEQIEKLKLKIDVTFKIQTKPLSKVDFVKTVKKYEILAITKRAILDIDKEIINSLPNLKSIAIYATGYEWLDVDHLHKKNIKISNLPNYCKTTVAEHTISNILTFSRRTHLSFDKIRGIIPNSTSLRGWDLQEKTVGIIGLGNIGKEFAKLIKHFGVKVYFFDKKVNESSLADFLPKKELLKKSDIIVLLASKERGKPPIIDSDEIKNMKKGVFIINTSRASLVNNKEILKAVKEKKIAGYSVDDDIEMLKNNNIEPGRILQTGHTAWYSTESIRRGTESWVNNIIALADGKNLNLVSN